MRRQRDPRAERSAIEAATCRLLAGTPLRSRSGRLTATELIVESGLRRDVIYAEHGDLVDTFHALVKAQNSTPAAMQELADYNTELKQKLSAVTAELVSERASVAVLRRLAVELSLELDQARQERGANANVVRLGPRSGPQLIGPC